GVTANYSSDLAEHCAEELREVPEVAEITAVVGRNPAGVARLAVRNAQTADELAFDGHALERGGEELGAAVHHQDFVPLLRQCGHLAGQAAHGRVVFEQCSREFDYGSH